MNVYRCSNQDIAEVEAFTENVFQQQKDLRQDFLTGLHNQNNKGTYVIKNEQELVVIATTYKSVWHPYCIYVRLAYNLHNVPREALQKLVEYLKILYKLPLLFLIDERFKALGEVLQLTGLRCIRKTKIIKIKPSEAKVNRTKNMKAVSEILHDPNLMLSFIGLCKTTYIQTHCDNPVGHFPKATWKKVVIEDLVVENSYVVIKNQQAIAFSLIYEGEEAIWELGWVGVDEYSPMRLLNLLMLQQLDDTARLGIEWIEKEVDSTCPYSLHLAKSFAHDVSETLFAYKS